MFNEKGFIKKLKQIEKRMGKSDAFKRLREMNVKISKAAHFPQRLRKEQNMMKKLKMKNPKLQKMLDWTSDENDIGSSFMDGK